MRAYNFNVKECSPTKLWHLTCFWVTVLTQIKHLRVTAVLKFGSTKNVQNLVRFTTTFKFDRKHL